MRRFSPWRNAAVPLREIARLLGDTEETVERVYAKHRPSYLKHAAAALQLTPSTPQKRLTV